MLGLRELPLQRQVHGPALESQRPGIHRCDLLRCDAVPAHRRHELHHHPGARMCGAQLVEVGEAGDDGDDAGIVEQGRGRVVEGSPRVQDDHVVRPSRLPDRRDLVGGADRQAVAVETFGLAGQDVQPEAVAVALGDGHQPRELLVDVCEMVTPGAGVDGQREGHVTAASGIAGRRSGGTS